jgi:hypothetical protein
MPESINPNVATNPVIRLVKYKTTAVNAIITLIKRSMFPMFFFIIHFLYSILFVGLKLGQIIALNND